MRTPSLYLPLHHRSSAPTIRLAQEKSCLPDSGPGIRPTSCANGECMKYVSSKFDHLGEQASVVSQKFVARRWRVHSAGNLRCFIRR